MENILNESDRKKMLLRVDSLTESDQRQWGKMNVNQMVCHLTDPLRVALKTKEAEPRMSLFKGFLIKKMAMLGPPIPKGKIETFKEIKQGDGGGTPPTNLSNDKKMLVEQINKFVKEFKEDEIVRHPSFGNMNKKEWARITYIHMNHHLKQFGR